MKKRNSNLSTHPIVSQLAALSIVLTTILGCTGIASGATCTWTGASGISSSWNYTANWQGGVYPHDGDDVVFPSGAARLVNTNAFTSLSLRSITFSGTGYTVRGNAVGLSNGITSTTNASVNTLELDLTLTADQSFQCSYNNSQLYVNGNVDLDSYTLTTVGAGQVRLGGVISGTGGVTKSGSGTHRMEGSAANTYTGTTRVNSGVLMLAKPGGNSIAHGELIVGDGLGSAYTTIVREQANYQIGSIPITINSDGWLDLDDYSDTVGAITFDGGYASSVTGTLSLGGNVTVSVNGGTVSGQFNLGSFIRTFDVPSGGNLQMNAIISGTGGITKSGLGFLTLAANNTYSGVTTVQNGFLQVSADSGLGTTAGGTVLQLGSLRLSSANIVGESLTVSGGYFESIGTSSSWSGAITLSSSLSVYVPNAGQELEISGAITGTGDVETYGVGTLILSGSGHNSYSGTTYVNEGTVLLNKIPNANAIPGDLIIGDGLGGAGADVVRSMAHYQMPSATDITINSSGLLDMNGYSDTIGHTLTLNGGGDVQTGSGTLAMANNCQVVCNASSLSSSISGTFNIGSGTCTFDVANGSAFPDLYMTAIVIGTGDLVKTGNGTLLSTGANTYSGATTINQGAVHAYHDSTFGSTSGGVTVSGTGSIQLVGANVGDEMLTLERPETSGTALSASGVSSWAGPIVLNANVSVSTGGNLDFSGVISGPGGIALNGAGYYKFSGSSPNTYLGNTVVNAGTLNLAKSGGNAVPHGQLIIGDGSGTDMVYEMANNQIGTIPIIINDSGSFDIDIFNDTVGDLRFNGGHVSMETGGLYLAGNIIVSNNAVSQATIDRHGIGQLMLVGTRTFEIAATPFFPDLKINVPIGGTGGFIKTGDGDLGLYVGSSFTGTATLNAGHTYLYNSTALGAASGGTVVNDGAVLILADELHVGDEPLTLNGQGIGLLGALHSAYDSNSWSGPITLASDSFITVLQTGYLNLTGPIDGSGGFTKGYPGTLILSGPDNNVYTGPTLVADGDLLMNKSGASRAIDHGSLTVGDGTGAEGSAVARELSQFELGSIPITVNADGLLDLNGFNDTVGNSLTLNDGGDVQTGAGTLTLGANSQIIVGPASSALSSRILGNINVGSGECVFDIENIFYMYAAMSGSANITKTGGDYMYLMSSNSFTGTMTVDESYLSIRDPWSLGSEAAGTFVNNAARLGLHTQVGNESLTMNSSHSYGAIFSSGATSPPATNSWAGPVTLLRDTSVRVVDGYVLNISGPISGPGGLTKVDGGPLILSGSTANTFAGNTIVNEGMLLLDKQGVDGALPGPGDLFIGDGVGGSGADVVRELRDYQIDEDVDITVNESGLLDLNDQTDTVGAVSLRSGRVATGTGTMSLLGNVAATWINGPSFISGRLGLGAVTRTFNVTNASPSWAMLFVDAQVSGTGGVLKTGEGFMKLGASNSYSGLTTVADGTLSVGDDDALGSTAAGTVVQDGGSLRLNNAQVGLEPLSLSGTGGSDWGTLFSEGNKNSDAWSGPITLQSDVRIAVGQSTNILTLSGVIDGPGGFTKRREGTLILSGSSPNAYSGNTRVDAGTLEMGKTSGTAVPHALYVGTSSGAEHSVVARNLHSAQSDIVTVNATGLYDLNGFNETLGNLTLNGGGDVQTGAGLLTLNPTSTLIVDPSSVSNATSQISGKLNVGTGQRVVDVQQTPAGSGNPSDLVIDAVISGGAEIVKEGPGELELDAANTFTGPFTLNAGALRLANAQGLGATTAGTSVNGHSYLQLHGAGIAVGAEPLTLNSTYEDWGTLYSPIGTNAWAGDITLQSSACIGVGSTSGVLELNCAIQGRGSLTVLNKGVVAMTGSATNTYLGDTHVNSGTLLLAKTIANSTIIGDLFIGNGSGGADSDVVRLDRGAQIANVRVTMADSGLFDLNGWAEYIGSLSGSGHVKMGSGILSTGADGSSTTYTGLIEGTGTLRKFGVGVFTLAADNTYSGPTEISSGTLLVNGSQPASDVTVAAVGQLAGTGTVGGIQSDGTVSPGSSPGVLSGGSTVLRSGSTFDVELNGFGPGTGHDQLAVRGAVKLDNAALNVSLGYLAAVGDRFVVLNNDGTDAITGTFAGLPDGATLTSSNATFTVDYAGGSGNDVVLTVTEVVPVEDLQITSIEAVGGDVDLDWTGGVPYYVVEKKISLTNDTWVPITSPTRDQQASVPMDSDAGFYRVSGGN